MRNLPKRVSLRLLLTSAAMLPATAYSQDTTVLSPIVVEGGGQTAPQTESQAGAATSQSVTGAREGEEGYLAETSTSATKTDTPVIETPQSISTVTREQLDDQNPQTVGQALTYTAGVLSNVDPISRYDSLFIRGFGGFGTNTRTVDFLDGLKMPRGQAWGIPSVDPFLLDRIDVLKGPSALLYGQTSPGGLVNQVSRMPSAIPYNELRVEGGSYGRLQGGFTSRGPIDELGKWQYSFTGIGRSSGTRYNDVDEERYAVAPALAWQPSADTRLTLLGHYQRDPEGGYFNSLYPTFLAPAQYAPYLDSEFNVGDPSFDHFERDQYGAGYIFEHRFNDVLSFESRLRYAGLETTFQGLQMTQPTPTDIINGTIPRQAARAFEEAQGIATDNHAQFDFATGGIGHKVLTGIDFQRTTNDFEFLLSGAQPLDVINPQYGLPVGPFMSVSDTSQTLEQTGIYVQDQMSLGGLRVVLGVRHDRAEQDTVNRPTDLAPTSSVSQQSSEETSYRAGALYLFDNGLAPYASYSTSFEPVIGVDADGNAFVPTTAQQWEAGIKYEPRFAKALFTFSAFDITQQNVLVPNPDNTNFNIQEGEIRSRGLEFEARGNATRNLELIGALTLLDTEVTESTTAANIGKRPQAVPEYFGSLWANYSFDTGALAGLTIGGGVRYVGSHYADDANTVKAPAYTVYDAALQYDLAALDPELEGIEATLNVSNLTDKEYYASCSTDFYCQFGNRRQVLAGLRYRW